MDKETQTWRDAVQEAMHVEGETWQQVICCTVPEHALSATCGGCNVEVFPAGYVWTHQNVYSCEMGEYDTGYVSTTPRNPPTAAGHIESKQETGT